MNYVIDVHSLNVRRYYIDARNFERYDLPLRVDQREKVSVGHNCFASASNLTKDISTLVPCNISTLALLLVMKLNDAVLSQITLA